MRASVCLGLAGGFALLASPILAFKRQYDEMMFETQPRDRAQIAAVLKARFGRRVTLLDVPEVNRDVNATVALVRTDGTVPFGVLLNDPERVYRFERVGGQEVCFQAHRPWEVELVRKDIARRWSHDD